MRRAAALFCLLSLLAALAACEQLPQPFQPAKPPTVFANLSSQSRIAVLPPQAADGVASLPGNSQRATEILAQALEDEGLLATPGHANGKMRRLKTVVRRVDDGEAAETQETVEVEWTLLDPNGFLIGNTAERFTLPAAAWEAGKPEMLQEIAAAAAPRVAAFLHGPEKPQAATTEASTGPETKEEDGIPGFPGARLVVLPIEGAPGDGGESLRRALERQLSLAELPTADSPSTGDLVVRGRVALRPAGQAMQQVTIVWTLEEAGRGGTLGEVSQANRVPAGSLDGAWGPAAEGVAEGAADGLFDLLDRLAAS